MLIKRFFTLMLSIVLSGVLAEANEIQVKDPKSKKVVKKEIYNDVWQKIYGGKENDIAYGVVALENGESVIVGTCKSYGAQRSDICLTRMSANGDMRWRLWLGGKKKDEGKAITRAADGREQQFQTG